jgi:hypothetical protein
VTYPAEHQVQVMYPPRTPRGAPAMAITKSVRMRRPLRRRLTPNRRLLTTALAGPDVRRRTPTSDRGAARGALFAADADVPAGTFLAIARSVPAGTRTATSRVARGGWKLTRPTDQRQKSAGLRHIVTNPSPFGRRPSPPRSAPTLVTRAS